VSVAILSESALSFLGFGFTVPDTSLGLLVSNGMSAIATRPWRFYLPGAFLTVLCVLVHLVGDGLRAALAER
jgi:peptide/nickel transport system permease protein